MLSLDVFLYTSEKIYLVCIGHFSLYSIFTECLNFTIFWTLDEVGNETNVWWVTKFCVTHIITGLEKNMA